MSDPLDPPFVTGFTKIIPAIHWITPSLPGLTEVIGRSACNKKRFFLFIQFVHLRSAPNIGTIDAGVNRYISDDFYVFVPAMLFECKQLLEEQILKEFGHEDAIPKLGSDRLNRRLLAIPKFFRPVVPRGFLKPVF